MTNPLAKSTSILTIELALGEPLSIAEVSEANGVTESSLLYECQKLINFYWRQFGTKAVEIIYDARFGYQLRAGSGVGAIGNDSLLISVRPKIPGVQLEKVIAMAQYSGDPFWNIGDGSVAAQIDSYSDYDLTEIMGFTLCDSVQKVFANGIQRDLYEVTETSYSSSSGPVIDESIAVGFVPPPLVSKLRESNDNQPNRIIKAALQKVAGSTSHSSLKSNAMRLISAFESVGDLSPKQRLDELGSQIFTTPRNDYSKALAISLAILRSNSLSLFTDSDIEVPSVLLDMDVVFERFCSRAIRDSLDANFYEVLLQPEYSHKIEPESSSKKIIPDVVVKSKKSNKTFILDIKNKYSSLDKMGKPFVSNPDLFQQFYYQQNLQANLVMLIYPTSKPDWVFPLPGAESKEKYLANCVGSVASEKYPGITVMHTTSSMKCLPLQIDLSGSMRNTINSIKRVAMLLQYFDNYE